MAQDQPSFQQFLSVPQCVCFNLRKTARWVTQLYDDALRPTGLRATQFSLLSATSHLGTATINQLAEVMVMDRTTLTRNLKPLESQGYLRIHPGKDRRQREVTLRAGGNNILKQAMPLWERTQKHVVESLGKDRTGRLLKDLHHATTQTEMM
ncbi:MAG: MarR family winged helix-turn-helix transcriptional regulator [Nitrospirota bacterium]|nr:MarR family winged helix-turn-helix transcriptional regulator [Nitrospirota bacterium]